ncbi:PHD finger protein EHD3-like isoform X2 [Canna indica]|uniref:PHD finger protein EHD3-like isoform X2 n=1 Tax=Canna indica TaxID=4628 RepID=A0AAQ3KAY6_9LILI|nr:PHD finger protein EHD3-like isoform X2 [Canna indica]
MAIEEKNCNGFLKPEESPQEPLITYKRRKRASPGTDAAQVLDTPSHKNKDIGWAHGEIVDGNTHHWMCNWCGLIRYSGGVTRLKKHLAGVCAVKKCPNVPEDIAKSILDHLIEKQKSKYERRRKPIKSSGNGGKILNGFHNGDITNKNCAKSNMEMQATSTRRFHISNKNKTHKQMLKSAMQQPKTTVKLHETGKSKGMKEPDNAVPSASIFQTEHHDRIISRWQKVLEYQFNLPYIKRGLGIWNVLHDALGLRRSELSEMVMVDVVEDNRQLKDKCLGWPEVKIQYNSPSCYRITEGRIVAEPEADIYFTKFSYYGKDTNTNKCEKAFLDILISEKFALLCDFLWETFEESKAKILLDFSLIDSKLKKGDYKRSPEFFIQDVQQIWDKVQKMGQEMVTIASSLSSIARDSCQKQETCQIDIEKKNSVGAGPTIQSNCCGSDCSTKPDRTEASDLYKVRTCKHCGAEANGEHSLICDGCEARYHFSCIKPAVTEIPTQSWYCAACSTKSKDSPDTSSIDTKKGSLHQNCVVCDRLEVSETLEDLDEHGSRTIVATDCGESSVSSMETEEAPGLSRTAMSSLCKICGACEDEDKKFLICGHIHCPYKFYHIRCLKASQIASAQQQNKPCWYCPSCLCRTCFCDKDDDNIVLCDGCDEAYHTYCMKPPQTSVPKGQWYCVPCNVAKAREGMRRYEQWILQQHRKNEGGQSSEVIGSMDLLLSAAEKLNSEEELAARR